jgi:ribosomal protein S18 acetylase RimI-like enzyme
MVVAHRQALSDDRDFCRSTHHLAYHDVVVSQFGPWDERRQDAFFDAKWDEGNIDVLLVDGQPCGFAAVSDQTDHLRVAELVIHPAWQRRGIGSEVLRGVMKRAADRNIPVRLRVLHENLAVGLYERLGFVKRSRSPTHFELEWAATGGPQGR